MGIILSLVFPLGRFIDLLRIYEKFHPPFFYTPKIGQVMIFSTCTYLHGFSDFFFFEVRKTKEMILQRLVSVTSDEDGDGRRLETQSIHNVQEFTAFTCTCIIIQNLANFI